MGFLFMLASLGSMIYLFVLGVVALWHGGLIGLLWLFLSYMCFEVANAIMLFSE